MGDWGEAKAGLGQSVGQGEVIAYTSEPSHGSNFYFGLRENGKAVDPLGCLRWLAG